MIDVRGGKKSRIRGEEGIPEMMFKSTTQRRAQCDDAEMRALAPN